MSWDCVKGIFLHAQQGVFPCIREVKMLNFESSVQ